MERTAKTSVSTAMMGTALLLAAAALAKILPSLLMPLDEDVQYVTRAAWGLLQGGNLSHSGVAIAFQVLRPDFHFTTPYWLHYFTPVLFFYSLFSCFGASDVVFYIGQALLLFLIGFMLAKKGMGWRASLGVIAVSMLCGTLSGSILLSGSQLPSIAVLSYFWLSWERKEPPSPFVQGIMMAIGWDCRPEGLLVGAISVFLNSRRWPDRHKRIRFAMTAILTACLTGLMLSFLRKSLGAAGSQDQNVLVWMSDILAPGFDTWGLAHLPTLREILVNKTIWGLGILKVLRNLGLSFTSKSMLSQRPDALILLVPFILAFFNIGRLRHYWLVGILLGLQIFTNATMAALSRYFDAAIFFCLWTAARDLLYWVDRKDARFAETFRACLLIGGGLILAAQLRGLRQNVQEALYERAQILRASEEAHRLVPQDAFVITDFPQLWTWYGKGDFCCFVPLHNPETMRLILEKFPRSYIVLFTPGMAGYPMGQFHRPPLSVKKITIFGPASTS